MKKFDSIEQTFLMIKPDGLKRGLVGRIFRKMEEAGLKLVAARMILATKEQAGKNYPDTDEWKKGIGEKGLASYDNDIKRFKEEYGTDDMIEVGQKVFEGLVKLLLSGPVLISVWEGNHAVDEVRAIAGATVSRFASPGTIRGDWGVDSPPLAVKSGRIVFSNLLHISDSPKEAKREITHWFGDKFKDLSDYDRVDSANLFDESW